MSKAIAKIGRENHKEHIVNVLPLITFIFGVQCYLMSIFTPEMNIGNFAITLAFTLVGFISMLYLYDNHHHVIIYPDKISFYFTPLLIEKHIFYQDIKSIDCPEEECKFATLVIKTADKNHAIFFVDFPVTVKSLIIEQMERTNTSIADDDQNIAA